MIPIELDPKVVRSASLLAGLLVSSFSFCYLMN